MGIRRKRYGPDIIPNIELRERLALYTHRDSIGCAECGRPAGEPVADWQGWRFWTDTRGRQLLNCPECSARDVARPPLTLVPPSVEVRADIPEVATALADAL